MENIFTSELVRFTNINSLLINFQCFSQSFFLHYCCFSSTCRCILLNSMTEYTQISGKRIQTQILEYGMNCHIFNEKCPHSLLIVCWHNQLAHLPSNDPSSHFARSTRPFGYHVLSKYYESILRVDQTNLFFIHLSVDPRNKTRAISCVERISRHFRKIWFSEMETVLTQF